MNIIVCMKQVPASSDAKVDPETGILMRVSNDTKTNPYDLYAIETALRIREKSGGTVTALTMGPAHAEAMMRDAYMMGVDKAVVLSDKKFAGSDVLATSHTLAQGVKALVHADLIICGKQTTDGDTAQIGPAMAEHLRIPHIAWVNAIGAVDQEGITVKQNLSQVTQTCRMKFPCLITVEKGIYEPRLPSYRRKKATQNREVLFLGFEDLPDKNLSKYGLIGSPTMVEKVFAPEKAAKSVCIDGVDAGEKADRIYERLKADKII